MRIIFIRCGKSRACAGFLAVAELLLDHWAIPRMDEFMRMNAGGADIARMTVGFAIPLLVAVRLVATLPRPAGRAARSAWTGIAA